MGTEDTIHIRIKHLVDVLAGGKNTVFARVLGISEANVRGYIKNVIPKADVLEKIVTSYDVNAMWLLSGIGDMNANLSQAPPSAASPPEGIPLIPIEAMAGRFVGEQSVLLQECERYNIPAFRAADFLIYVRGDSMQPRYFSGDMVACKLLPLSDVFFQWGKVYVLDTDQGALIKKVERGEDESTILIVSENKAYPPFLLPRAAIYRIAIVIGLVRTE